MATYRVHGWAKLPLVEYAADKRGDEFELDVEAPDEKTAVNHAIFRMSDSGYYTADLTAKEVVDEPTDNPRG